MSLIDETRAVLDATAACYAGTENADVVGRQARRLDAPRSHHGPPPPKILGGSDLRAAGRRMMAAKPAVRRSLGRYGARSALSRPMPAIFDCSA